MISSVRKAVIQRNGVTINDKAVFVTYDDGTELCVPTDNANRHYIEVLEWIADGGTVIDNPPE